MAKEKMQYAAEDTFGAQYNELDADFVAWMTSHEESVRQAWVYDEVWASEEVKSMPTVFIVRHGKVVENFFMNRFLGKWEKHNLDTMATFVGYSLETMQEVYKDLTFVARRAHNTITGEVLFYQK